MIRIVLSTLLILPPLLGADIIPEQLRKHEREQINNSFTHAIKKIKLNKINQNKKSSQKSKMGQTKMRPLHHQSNQKQENSKQKGRQ